MKRLKLSPLAPLCLHLSIPVKDVRRIIWSYLDEIDREIIRCAHNSCRIPRLPVWYGERMVERGYLNLMKWAYPQHMVFAPRAIAIAVRESRIDVLQWFNDCVWHVMVWAFECDSTCGLRAAVKSAIEKRNAPLLACLVNRTARGKSLDDELDVTGYMLYRCRKKRDVDLLQWVWSHFPSHPHFKHMWWWAIQLKNKEITLFLDSIGLLPRDTRDVEDREFEWFKRGLNDDIYFFKWLVTELKFPFKNKEKWLSLLDHDSEHAVWIRSL